MTIVAGCEIPQPPGDMWWDVDLNVPFGVRTYGMWELADPDSVIRANGSGIGMSDDSTMYFSAWAGLIAEIGDSLYASPVERTIDRYLTAIEAPLDYDTLLGYSLGSLNPGLAALHGTVQDVPPHALEHTIALPLPAGYDSLEVDTATISIVIINRLAYEVTGLQLRAGSKVIADVSALNSDQQFVDRVSLAEAILISDFTLALTATGQGGTGISVDSASRISVSVRVDTATASRFYGFVPEQTVVRDSAVSMEQRHRINLAIIESGNMIVTLANQTQFADTVTLRIPNLVSRLNDTLAVKRFLMPGDSDVAVIPLALYRLRPSQDEDQKITGQIISHTPATADRRAFAAGNEHVYARVEFERLPIEYFAGTLNNLELPIEDTQVEIDRPPQGWEKARPLDVTALLHVEQGIGGLLDAEITAHTSVGGETVGDTIVNISNLSLVSDSLANVNGLATLLADYPDLLTVSGTSVLHGEIAVYNNARVRVGLELRAALAVDLTGDIEPEGEVERVSPRDLEDIQSGTATIRIWNHLPTDGRCFLVAGFDSASLLKESGAGADTLFDVLIPAPTVVNGMAVDASHLSFDVMLDERWLNFFKSEHFFVRTQIAISAARNDTLVLTGRDFVAVQPFAKIVYTVRPGEIE